MLSHVPAFVLILNRGAAMFYLFVCLTQDGWMEIFQACQVEQSGVFVISNKYFLALSYNIASTRAILLLFLYHLHF